MSSGGWFFKGGKKKVDLSLDRLSMSQGWFGFSLTSTKPTWLLPSQSYYHFQIGYNSLKTFWGI